MDKESLRLTALQVALDLAKQNQDSEDVIGLLEKAGLFLSFLETGSWAPTDGTPRT